MSPDNIEWLAERVLANASTSSPVDAFVLAQEDYDLRLTPCDDESFSGDEIRFRGCDDHRSQREFVALCVSRVVLESYGFAPTTAVVAHLARALILPRYQFDPSGSVDELAARHPYASRAMLGARATDTALTRQASGEPASETSRR